MQASHAWFLARYVKLGSAVLRHSRKAKTFKPLKLKTLTLHTGILIKASRPDMRCRTLRTDRLSAEVARTSS